MSMADLKAGTEDPAGAERYLELSRAYMTEGYDSEEMLIKRDIISATIDWEQCNYAEAKTLLEPY